MSPALPVKTKPSHDERALEASSFLSSSYVSFSILARDPTDCFEDEHAQDTCNDGKHGNVSDRDDDHDDAPVTHGPSLMSRLNGITYGTLRPTIAAEAAGSPALDSRPLLSAASTTSPKTTTPLLYNTHPHHPESTPTPTTTGQDPPHPDVLGTTTWQREAKTLTHYSRSLITTFLLHYSVTATSVFTIGRLGRLELGAVSLATMTANMTCYAPCQGLATCLDTLCAQAYGSFPESGHGKKRGLVGLQLQRMTLFLWVLLVPVAGLWWWSGWVLGRLIPDDDNNKTAALAGVYLRVLILGTPGVAAFESGKRFVQAQGLFHATTWVLLVGAPVNVLANWVFVGKMGWGFVGAASAVVFTQNLLPVLLLLYVRFVEGMECWDGWSRRALSNWGPMIKLALPGMIMVEAQYFAFEVLTLASSHFGSSYLAAQSVVVTLTSILFNISFPLAIAASTRVANLIGARLSDAARTSAKVALVAACLVGLFNSIFLNSLRFKLPFLFTQDEEVAAIVSHVLPICAVLQLFDSLAAMSHGLLRGIGRQGIGGYMNLFAHYCVSLPISFATGWALGWKLEGLWCGVTTGLAVVFLVELWYLHQADWQRAVEEADKRIRSDEVHIPFK
ncbi:mate-domain-containing protein [Chaetomidium leptoderma]|uniref:Mate-domain-containing protein n=1 Tax=Chaetomidium leptoderma TaxID=669021 RepID=A0AAN6VRR5_9PEZI|nr:mate-domain-containing protein [Chaetomidium leptoderma]